MKIIRQTFFPIIPRGAIRATQNMFWLTKITEEAAIDLDNKWNLKDTSIGKVWVSYKKDKHGIMKEFARKSPPSYQRMRKYLIAQYDAVKWLKMSAEEQGFIMPEDDFVIEMLMPMPKSWTKKKKKLMEYKMHKAKPDSDNAFKMLTDSMFKDGSTSGRFRNDSCVSSFICVKYYVPDDVQFGFNIIELNEGAIINMINELKKPLF